MAVNKVIYGGNVLIDLTGDSVTKDKVLKGVTAHDKTGAQITGTCEYDVNSQEATAAVDEILKGKTAFARGVMLTGTMPNNGSKSLTISRKSDSVPIPQGYHDGSGRASLDPTEAAKIIADNIRDGTTILGVTGTLLPGGTVTAQAKTVTPTTSEQTVLPDSGKDYLTQVTVAAIPYVETNNAAGGKTVTIA